MLSSRTRLEQLLVGNISWVKESREGESESGLGEGRSERENSRKQMRVKAEGCGDCPAQRRTDSDNEGSKLIEGLALAERQPSL